MAVTKQVLRLQSDQILEDPQVGTRVRLKDLVATRAINLLWVEPAGSDRDVTFKDPGANDAVVYENLAQTLTNKTIDTPTITDFTNAQHDHSNVVNGGSVDHSDITNPDATDDHAQYVKGAGRASGQTIIGGTAASESLTLESTSDGTKGTIIALDNIVMSGVSEVTGLPAVPTGATAAASKAYVDASVSGGASWKEVLLTSNQLDSANNGISQAGAFYLANTAQIGDTFVVNDGATSETWTFAAGSAPNAPAIGASALASLTDLAARINTDSAKWAAFLATSLQGINPAGNVVIVYRVVPLAATTDRIYGVFTTPADAQFVNYGAELDYRSSTSANLPAADPTTANFGLGRVLSGLEPNDTHQVRNEDNAFVWNEDNTTWQLSGGAVVLATSGAGGGVVGQSTFDETFGIEITGSGARVRVDTSTITFDGGGQLTVAGGAVPVATSGSGGATEGKATFDSDKGLLITGGPGNAIAEVKVDTTTIAFNPSGELSAAQQPRSPTGLISVGQLLTRNIPAVTPPTPGFISSDIPIQDYVDAATTGQLFDFVVPSDYDSGDIEILATFQMTTAAGASSVVLETAAKIVLASSGSVDTGTFPLTPSVLPVPATTDITRSVLATFPNPSGANYERGDTLQFYVKRLGADGSDTHTGDWRVSAFATRYLGQVATRLMEFVGEAYSAVSGTPMPPSGFFDTDVPIINFSDVTDQAASSLYVVPDNWDGLSDAHFQVQYALDAAASGTVRLNTLVRIVDVVGGSVVVQPSVDFDRAVTADTDPHRTQIIRSIDGSVLSPGSVVQVILTRDTAVGGNPAAGFQLIASTVAFGITPTSGISTLNDYYLDDPVVGNLAGTVFADWAYPSFAGDFEQFYRMNSTAAAGAVHVAFAGRLADTQSSIDQVRVFLKGVDTGTVTYNLKIYAEGSGAVPVFASGATTPLVPSTAVTVLGPSLSAQPTGTKRFFVVVEAETMANGEEVSVSKPFVQVS
jgi:hypothetical protein